RVCGGNVTIAPSNGFACSESPMNRNKETDSGSRLLIVKGVLAKPTVQGSKNMKIYQTIWIRANQKDYRAEGSAQASSVRRRPGADHKRGGWMRWWLGPSASAYRPELDTNNLSSLPHSSFLFFPLPFRYIPPQSSPVDPTRLKAVMYGPHSRLLLLTIALLLEETFLILLPYSQADPRKDLGHGSCAPYDVERRKRPLWLS
ncbi:2663_t:CDS:1, partial [Acaulospora colombiana]